MAEPSETRPPRLALVLLTGVLVWLTVNSASRLDSRLFTLLAAVVAVGYLAWRFHGLIAAGAAVLAFRFLEGQDPSPSALNERGTEALFLATLALSVAAMARQGKAGRAGWWCLALVAIASTVFGWWRIDIPQPLDAVMRERLVHLALAISVLALLLGLTTRGSWRDRLLLVLVICGPPTVGMIGGYFARREWPTSLGQGEWPGLLTDLRTAIAEDTWAQADWSYPSTWLMGPLILLGIYRSLARGREQRRRGEAPSAWLFGLGLVGLIAAGAYRAGYSGSMAQAAGAALLAVFGVADAIQALVERIALPAPDTGPSNVPRVK